MVVVSIFFPVKVLLFHPLRDGQMLIIHRVLYSRRLRPRIPYQILVAAIRGHLPLRRVLMLRSLLRVPLPIAIKYPLILMERFVIGPTYRMVIMV